MLCEFQFFATIRYNIWAFNVIFVVKKNFYESFEHLCDVKKTERFSFLKTAILQMRKHKKLNQVIP